MPFARKFRVILPNISMATIIDRYFDLTFKLGHPIMPRTISFSRFEHLPYVTEALPARECDIFPHVCREASIFSELKTPTRIISTTGAEAISLEEQFVSKSCSVGGPVTKCLIEPAKAANCSESIKAWKESTLFHSILD
jgi:hypothetical protein